MVRRSWSCGRKSFDPLPVESGGAMPWKPVTGQVVIARLDGHVREFLVTAWNSDTGDVKVAWPPQNPAVASRRPLSSNVGKTQIAEARYEPLDPDAFRSATRG